jgi:hypothetical protein
MGAWVYSVAFIVFGVTGVFTMLFAAAVRLLFRRGKPATEC